MDDQEREGKRATIRVVKETPEEVVRLDAPKRARIEKSGRISAEKIEDKNLVEAESEQESREFDPEEEWREEMMTEDAQAVPMGWFVLLGLGLLGVIVWTVCQTSSSSDEYLAGGAASGVSQQETEADQPLGKIEDDKARNEAARHFENTELLIRNFLAAWTPEEKAKYVRHPERVKPLMEDFYSWNVCKSIVYRKLLRYQAYSLENLPFLALEIEDEDGDRHAILIEDGPDGLLVDWESFVCFQPVNIDDYARNKPTEATTLRAYVTPDYFHSYEFESQDVYSSFRLKFRGSEVLLNGYVERGTELDEKFRKLFPRHESRDLKPLIVTVRFLEGGQAQRSVLIEGLESVLWAYPSDPAEVASSKE